jgi:hypothetical protein
MTATIGKSFRYQNPFGNNYFLQIFGLVTKRGFFIMLISKYFGYPVYCQDKIAVGTYAFPQIENNPTSHAIDLTDLQMNNLNLLRRTITITEVNAKTNGKGTFI